MKPTLLWLLLLFAPWFSWAQQTHGPQSPNITGDNAHVSYVNNYSRKVNIPEGLRHYIVGLMLTNDIHGDTTTMGKAFRVWLDKYNELLNDIDKSADPAAQIQLKTKLNTGDFAAVESGLKIHTSYKDLSKTFPGTYLTTGDQSPIIVGDFATVSYVVNEVITYDLPEGLTIDILNDLRTKESTIGSLQTDLGNSEVVISQWINRYQKLRDTLKNSPSAIYQRAYKYFKKGQLKEALKQLDHGATNETEFASSRLLKARILMLQLNNFSMDSSLAEINKCYSVAIQLTPTVGDQYEYGKFLMDYYSSPLAAAPIFEKIIPAIKDRRQLIEVLNYTGLAYSYIDKIKATDYWHQAIGLLDDLHQEDSQLMEKRTIILANLAQCYFTSGTRATIGQALDYSDSALRNFSRIKPYSEKLLPMKILIYVQRAREYVVLRDTTRGGADFRAALDLLEPAAQRNPGRYLALLANTYSGIAEMYSNFARQDIALGYLREAQTLIEPHLSLNAKFYLGLIENLYTATVRNYQVLGQADSVMSYLRKFDRVIDPYVVADPKTFDFHRAAVYTDLGGLFLFQGRFDSAYVYLSWASHYYLSNPTAATLDKVKFSTCLAQWNQVLIKRARTTEALSYNHSLLRQMTSHTDLARFGYQDFVPQVYAQLAEVYLNKLQFDSAATCSDSAVNLIRPLARQYGLTYLTSYLPLLAQGCNIRLFAHRYPQADSLAQLYIQDCADISVIDLTVRDSLQGQVGDNIAGLANVFFQFGNNPLGDALHWQTVFGLADAYYGKAERYYLGAYKRNNAELYRYCVFLLGRAGFEAQWGQRTMVLRERNDHLDKRCRYAGQCKNALVDLPATPARTDLVKKLDFISASCPPE